MPQRPVLVVAGDAAREFLGTEVRERMRLSVDGQAASLPFLASYFRHGRDSARAAADLASRRRFLPLNGPWLRQVLEDAGHPVRLITSFSEERDAVAAALAERPLAAVISTTFLPLAAQIEAVAGAIKQMAPDLPVIAGGAQVWKSWQHRRLREAGGIADEIAGPVAEHNYLMDLDRPSALDALIVSPSGETTLLALLERLAAGRSWHDLPNLAWRDSGPWRINEIGADTGRTVSLDWSRAPEAAAGPVYVPVQAGQGCGLRCAFCDFCGLHPKPHLRDPAEIVAEIASIPPQGGLRRVYFTDDNLFVTPQRAKSLLRALIRAKLGLRWRGMFHLSSLDDEVADLLAESGCLEVLLGIESGDPAILTAMGKRTTPERILAGLRRLDGRGLHTKSTFIVGFPGETPASVDRTVDLINAYPQRGTAIHRVMMFTFAVLPLSAVARPEARAKSGLRGYGFHWKHATMDSAGAAAELERALGRLSDEVVPSYVLEVPELPGLTPPQLQRAVRLRNQLAAVRRDPARAGEEADLWSELARIFAKVKGEAVVGG